MSVDFKQYIETYERDGYVVLPNLYSTDQIEKWKKKHAELMGDYEGQTWFGNMLEYAPKLMWPAVCHPVILDFLEQVMGPFVQLDNLTLAAFPSVLTEETENKVSGWHRDRWAQFPQDEIYRRPSASNAISYLQDLTDDFGPLRVISGSHRHPVSIEDTKARSQPHPDETLIYMKAGDVVVTHNGLIHSGTPNTSGQLRYFFSIYYNSSWLKHTDNHSGPLTQKILAEARSRNDYRHMRLVGEEPQLQARSNSGFLVPDRDRWQEWSDADRNAMKSD